MTTRTAPPDDGGFRKALGTIDAAAIGFGAMIGFGWVVLVGDWLQDAGTAGAVVAMVGGGLIMGVVAFVYAELIAAIPKAGGEHNYLLRGLGARWSFVGSWGIVGGYISVVAFEAVALPRTAAYLWPQIESVKLWTLFGTDVHLVWALVGGAGAVFVTAINYVGVKVAGIVQSLVVLVLLLIGALLVFGSATGGSVADMEPMFTSTTGLFAVLIAVPFMFVGFDVIPQSAEELNMAPRKMGTMIIVAVGAATLWYVMVIVTAASGLNREEMASADLVTADAMGALFNSPTMANVLLIGGLAGILTSWIALLMGAARLLYAMGVSGMLPAWFGRLHPRFRTPANAVLFIGAISFAAPFLGPAALGWFVDSGSPSIVITYMMVCIVFVLLRKREPDMERPFWAGGRRGGIPLGILGAVLTAGLLILYIPGMPAAVSWQAYLLFAIWWLVGLVFVLRIPKGIYPGEDAEERLLDTMAMRTLPPRSLP